MAKLAALATAPIGYTDPSTSSQLSIPTSLIYFEDGSAKFTPPAGMSASTSADITKWLAALAREGILTSDAQAPPVPAMVISAKSAGSAGNSIEVEITNVRPKPADATKTIFDITLTETNTYELLKPQTVKAVVGTAAGGGDKPGLVFVSSGGNPSQPKDGVYPMTGDPATADIAKADGSAGAFVLTTKAGGADAALTKVTISAATDPANPGTFTLEAVWTKAAAGIEPADLVAALGYEITVAPPDGGALAPPAAGGYALSGGGEVQAATKASASIPTGS